MHQTHKLFQGLHWDIRPGEQWALIGANGSGKTALAALIGRRLPIASGQRRYADGFSPKHDIAYVSFEAQADLLALEARRDISELCDNAFDKGTSAGDVILQGRV